MDGHLDVIEPHLARDQFEPEHETDLLRVLRQRHAERHPPPVKRFLRELFGRPVVLALGVGPGCHELDAVPRVRLPLHMLGLDAGREMDDIPAHLFHGQRDLDCRGTGG